MYGDNMIQVEAFEEENEEDLRDVINSFLEDIEDSEFIDIKYSSSHFISKNGEQVFSFSAIVIYKIMVK